MPNTFTEQNIIELFCHYFPTKGKGVLLGVGDDATILSLKYPYSVVTTDTLNEGIHFDSRYFDFFSLGQKAMNVNLSDIAAMGAKPYGFWCNLSFPSGITPSNVGLLAQGMKSASEPHHLKILGGDTCLSKHLSITLTVLGVSDKKPFHLTAAKEGDRIYITNTLGENSAGFDILSKHPNLYYHHHRNHKIQTRKKYLQPLIQRHLSCQNRVELALLLHRFQVHALTDISDGLLRELSLMISRPLGAEIDVESIPIGTDVLRYCKEYHGDPYFFALAGGEDYELLFTVSENENHEKMKNFFTKKGNSITCIGIINRSGKIHYSRDIKYSAYLAEF